MLSYYLGNFFSNKPFNESCDGFKLIRQFIADFDTELFIKECPEDNYGTKDYTLLTIYVTKSRLDNQDKKSMMEALNYYYKLLLNWKRKTN
jgi:hypothetical protein